MTDAPRPGPPAGQPDGHPDWEAIYERGGNPPWERTGPNPALIAWQADGVLRPCRILVPGAGRSAEPLVLAEAGFDVTVLDSAETASAYQRHALGREEGAEIVEADLFGWEPEDRFDAIYDQACFCALLPAQRPSYIGRLHRWLAPGGRLFILFMQTGRDGGPPYDCPMDEMRRLFRLGPDRTGWDWPGALPDPVPHPSGFAERPAVLHRVP